MAPRPGIGRFRALHLPPSAGFEAGRSGRRAVRWTPLPFPPKSGTLARVDRAEFLQLREAVTNNLPPASGAPLDDAAARLRRRLVSSVMFAQVEVEVTDDPDRLLVALESVVRLVLSHISSPTHDDDQTVADLTWAVETMIAGVRAAGG